MDAKILMEKANQANIGIRARQSGITMKEYFLNQRNKVKNLARAQKQKLNEAIERASELVKSKNGERTSESKSFFILNKAGKNEKVLLCVVGDTYSKVLSSFKKITSMIYSNLKYRIVQVNKLCSEGISKASKIIKGKSDTVSVSECKNIKSEVGEYMSLINSSLSDMRSAFVYFKSIIH